MEKTIQDELIADIQKGIGPLVGRAFKDELLLRCLYAFQEAGPVAVPAKKRGRPSGSKTIKADTRLLEHAAPRDMFHGNLE